MLRILERLPDSFDKKGLEMVKNFVILFMKHIYLELERKNYTLKLNKLKDNL